MSEQTAGCKDFPDFGFFRLVARNQHGLDEFGALNIISECEEALTQAVKRAEQAEAELRVAREALEWALSRVSMPGCRCSTGGCGDCTCDYASWPEYKMLAKAREALKPRATEGSGE